MAHHTLTPNGLVLKNVLAPIGQFFGERLGFNAAGQYLGGAFTATKGFFGNGLESIGLSSAGWLGKTSEAIGLTTAGSYIGNVFSTIMAKEAITTGMLAPFIGASTLTIGNIAAIGAAIPLVGLGVNAFRNMAAKRAAQAAAELAAQSVAKTGSKLSGKAIAAIAGGGVIAGTLGSMALGSGSALKVGEAGQQLSKLI